MPERFAIYFVPAPESTLYRFGARVLGYDAYTGTDCPFPSDAGANWAPHVAEPRRYGFHATLKAPFRLAEGARSGDLADALDRFAATHASVGVGPLAVREIGAFVALVPTEPCRALHELADACVRGFDSFRAPLSEAERARRLAVPLTERQRDHLDRWGYPYVFDDFRFHMTLTGPLQDGDRLRARDWLSRRFAEATDAHGLTVDRLVLARQADGGPFRIVRSAILGGMQSSKA